MAFRHDKSPRTPTRRGASPGPRWGYEPKVGVYELRGYGGPPHWHYSAKALEDAALNPRYDQAVFRNPELAAQMDSMSQSVDRVQEAALQLRRAAGEAGTEPVVLRSALEAENRELNNQIASLRLQVAALVQSLTGLGASAFNWSDGLGTPRRKGLGELVLRYCWPLSHIDSRVEDLCADLSAELRRDRLDDYIRPWEPKWGEVDVRSPAPGSTFRPERSKFQMQTAVQSSLRAGEPGLSATLTVTILGAEGLRKADATSKSDPYCVCRVPGKPSSKFQTGVSNNTQKPQWDYTFALEHQAGEALEFTVWDKDIMGDDHLGKVLLPPAHFLPDGFEGELTLEGDWKNPGRQGILRVKIAVTERDG